MTTINLPKDYVYYAVLAGFVLMFVRSVQVAIQHCVRATRSSNVPTPTTVLKGKVHAAAAWGFLVLMLLGVPVAIAMAASSLLYILVTGVTPDVTLAQRMIAGVESFPLLAVPFFILAGNLMNIAGVTGRIYNFAVALVGWMRGGLARSTSSAR